MRGTASLLLVGVLAQGVILLRLDIDASFGMVATVAVASGVMVALVTYVAEPRLEWKGRV